MEELRIREISRHTADSAFARWFKAVGNHTHWLAGYLDSILSKPSWLSPSLQGVISTQKLRMWEWRRPVLTAISGVERKYISVLFPSSDSCLTAGMPSGCWTMIMRLCHRRSLKKKCLSLGEEWGITEENSSDKKERGRGLSLPIACSGACSGIPWSSEDSNIPAGSQPTSQSLGNNSFKGTEKQSCSWSPSLGHACGCPINISRDPPSPR